MQCELTVSNRKLLVQALVSQQLVIDVENPLMVQWRGRIGGDRAVRAQWPFPAVRSLGHV